MAEASAPVSSPDRLEDHPVELLRRLLRFDTSNPPGNERECIVWIQGLLEELGCEVRILAREPGRPNLIARLPGRGVCPPLLLQGHVDVVAATGRWLHPPFAGDLADGHVWGRGALDMKGGVAMMLAAFMRAQRGAVQPPGDVILALMADEEEGSDLGAKFLVEEHPELFKDVRYAIGEFGGFTMEIAGRRIYPIMVAEKRVCWSRVRIRGAGGHGSLPTRDSAMGKVGRLLTALERHRLPVHVTPVARMMIEAIAAEVPRVLAPVLRGLTHPSVTDRLLDVLGERGSSFDPLLHNTANATLLRGGEKINVIPDEVCLDLDCRLLPGYRAEHLFAELRALAGIEMELEILRHEPAEGVPDLTMFATLAEILRELDPAARPVPLLLAGMTDGRFFQRLGIQTYGFLPMALPSSMRFTELIHANNERIPLAALEFGTQAIERALSRFT